MLEQLISKLSIDIEIENIADINILFFDETFTYSDVIAKFYSDYTPDHYTKYSFTMENIFVRLHYTQEEIDSLLENVNSLNVPYIIDIYDTQNGWCSYENDEHLLCLPQDGDVTIHSVTTIDEKILCDNFPILKSKLEYCRLFNII